MMHDREKSDSAIVAGKLTKKAGKPATESVEPRAGAEDREPNGIGHQNLIAEPGTSVRSSCG